MFLGSLLRNSFNLPKHVAHFPRDFDTSGTVVAAAISDPEIGRNTKKQREKRTANILIKKNLSFTIIFIPLVKKTKTALQDKILKGLHTQAKSQLPLTLLPRKIQIQDPVEIHLRIHIFYNQISSIL